MTILLLLLSCSCPPADDSASDDSAPVETHGGFDTSFNGSCSSGSEWTDGDRGSDKMNPGEACNDCHNRGEGPKFPVAGTVMGAIHDPDDCNGVEDVTVIITDANGTATTLTTNSAGNFFIDRGSVKTPYTAVIEHNGVTREMLGSQTDGDCNTCHSADGTDGAPGRIVVP
ncbi:MAG: hypothetical protein EXR69_08765 [Myxococcales bacterium]|nr:hypothetical protein [Myxococcales bacterium]